MEKEKEKERTDLDKETWKQVERLRATRNAVDEYVYIALIHFTPCEKRATERYSLYSTLQK